ncbi:MAG: UvrD-helicase domain-containing protein, partial [Anaerolineae bacterium]|nr:UvrD-helicase domain-containing protein [Anaerolineae bacterium]
EDEAQDSSRMQEDILRLLVGSDGNWIRVGDPNQAIYETFTTASPYYLINFLNESGVTDKKLSNSGRSSTGIIALANYLIDWTRSEHPVLSLRNSLNYPLIEPAPPGDPQPNPPFLPNSIYISTEKYTPDQELNMITKSAGRWVKDNPDSTVAILVPRNERGSKVIAELNAKNIPNHEMLNSTDSTRNTARLLADILSFLDSPSQPTRLAKVYSGIHLHGGENKANQSVIDANAALIKKCPRLEDYLFPWPGRDWLGNLAVKGYSTEILTGFSEFRDLIIRWLSASLLQIDQLLLTISMDIFINPADLALTHKLALALERAARTHPDWRLSQYVQELNLIASNERRFLGFTTEDIGFDPDQHKGKVVVSTIHKAKGLEWDRVYMLSVNNYDFPSAEEGDSFISERWFIRDKLNLQAETISRLEALISGDTPGLYMEEGFATQKSRLEYASERLRLLFVGITRARKELSITSNNGKRGEAKPALPLAILSEYWKDKLS